MEEPFRIDLFGPVQGWLAGYGLGGFTLTLLSWSTIIVGIVLLAWIADLIAKRIFLVGLGLVIKRTKTTWDDALLENRVLHRAAHIAPALVIYRFAAAFVQFQEPIERLAYMYMLVVGGLVIGAVLNAAVDVYRSLEISRNRPIKGFAQVVKIIVWVVLTVLIVAVLFEQSPFGLLGGLGALTAVLILVFKDSILGLVASFQITSADMVRIGDWIEVPQFGADGEVADVSLHTVKVQNWDKTISTVPTYALISGTFKNWRGMAESGGRRIKRAVYLDMTSVRFCDDALLQRFSRFQYLREYLARKTAEIAADNEQQQVDSSELINGRRLTNIGTFRAYLQEYLRRHPKIRTDMTLMVRQLPPSEHGLPIEVYVFSNDQVWTNYEAIQADIFDHILAVVPLFDLRVFQNPTGFDVRQAAQELAAGKP